MDAKFKITSMFDTEYTDSDPLELSLEKDNNYNLGIKLEIGFQTILVDPEKLLRAVKFLADPDEFCRYAVSPNTVQHMEITRRAREFLTKKASR